jgi:2,4-dienoyl-CoA reductase-like NADH-dependent reductase (Old Yellow Enzyme family)
MNKLFDLYQLGSLTLQKRIVMAPLNRARAGHGDSRGELNAEYYRQHVTVGLIISEVTQVSKQGQGYRWTPGIYSQEQVSGWKKVTEAVHSREGKIFLQMRHVVPISRTSLRPNGAAPVSFTDKEPENRYVFAYDEAGVPYLNSMLSCNLLFLKTFTSLRNTLVLAWRTHFTQLIRALTKRRTTHVVGTR